MASLLLHPIVVVFLGAGTGGVLRHLMNLVAPRLLGAGFPFATLIINVSGSFLMGVMTGYLAFRNDLPFHQELRLFLTTGLLGGYTTFSTFSLDFLFLMERGETLLALAYVLGSVALGLLGVFAGIWLLRTLS